MTHPVRVFGLPARPADPVELSAGPLKLLFDEGEIRYIRLGGRELLRRVYVAVRDRDWGTIPGRLTEISRDVTPDSFAIRFTMQHTAGDIDFRWRGTLSGDARGRIRFEMSGAPQRDLLTNRTGFCVLHPLVTCVKQPCTVTHVDGSETAGAFPDAISPHQPFKGIRAITQTLDGITWRVTSEGETFEMEDQRNWSDGSFKTYCRPLELPFPYKLAAGETVQQTITIELLEKPAELPEAPPATEELDLGAVAHGEWVPLIGVAVAEGFEQLDARALAAIESLHLRHLRLDLNLATDGWRDRLTSATPNLKRLNLPLEVALRLPNDPKASLAEFAGAWQQAGLKAIRWIILPASGVTTLPLLEAARDVLAPLDDTALFGGGTDADFVTINRKHPPVEATDFVSFALNPQVHASDNLSIIENLESQSDLIASAVKLSDGHPIAISPISLKQRFNPVATSPDTAAASDELPRSVDPRQMSLFAAAWMVGTLSRLCAADYLTYFETHGWRGILQGPFASPSPARFPAAAGELFPVYHVLKSLLGFNPEHWSAPAVRNPLRTAGILLQKPGRQRLLLANLATHPARLTLSLPQPGTLTRLDADALGPASRDPEFWVNATSSAIAQRATLELGAYAVVQVDWSLL